MNANKQKRTGGFTLIELIVVIAILGILAGVGTVAYTGYIKAANKGIDKQTVGDLIYAAQLADYADPNLFRDDGTAMIAVTAKGTSAAGTYDSAAFKAALKDAVGNLDEVKLTYTDWEAIDGATFKSMKDSLAEIGYTDAEGNIIVKDEDGNALTASYAANADQLWELVEAAASQQASDGSHSAEEYLALAAQYTVQTEAIDTGEKMANAWASNSLAAIINPPVGGTNNKVVLAARSAANMARNHAFAEYVQNNYKGQVSSTAINYLQIDGDDVVYSLINSANAPDQSELAGDWTVLREAAQAYISGGSSSQAYADGMIYYALMFNIDDVTTKGIYSTDDPNYLSKIGNYVSIAGAAFSGKVDWDSMVQLANTLGENDAGSTVIINISKSGGSLHFDVQPDEVDPRDEDEQTEAASCAKTHNSSITISSTKITIQVKDESATAVNAIDICTIDPAYKTCTIQDNITSNSLPYTVTVTDGSNCITVSDGVITAVKPGTATLHFDNGKKQKDLTVNVH